MQTEEVQSTVSLCHQALEAIDNLAFSMNSSFGYLDWVSPASASFCEEAQASTRQIESLVETGRDQFARLDREQVAWEEMGRGFHPIKINSNYMDQGMKITPDKFSIKFTNTELAFATSVLGFYQISLFSQEDWQNIDRLMVTGQRSLEAHGLLRVGVPNQMEIDVFLDGLIHWIQDPDWVMVIKVHTPTAEDDWKVFSHRMICYAIIRVRRLSPLCLNPLRRRDLTFCIKLAWE